MATVMFIHGSGVREPDYTTTFGLLERALRQRKPAVRLWRCSWGEEVGARFHHGGRSVPRFAETKAIALPGDEAINDRDALYALWELLYQDPLYELRALRLIAAAGNTPAGAAAADRAGAATLDSRVRGLPQQTIPALAGDSGMHEAVAAAVEIVTAATPYRDLINSAAAQSLIPALARAIVAALIRQLDQSGAVAPISLNADLRDAAVTDVAALLRPAAIGKGIIGDAAEWAKDQLAGVALNGLSWYTEPHRGNLTQKTVDMTGDIFLYQGRGQELRDYIRAQIVAASAADRDLTLLAHSLGGVAAVDLLIMERLPVKQLITVGSQAPLFYEINALHSRQYDEPLPEHFPPWLNIYDPRDLLGYIAAGVFNPKDGPPRVGDLAVDNRQPYPRAHSAYWANAAVLDAVAARLG